MKERVLHPRLRCPNSHPQSPDRPKKTVQRLPLTRVHLPPLLIEACTPPRDDSKTGRPRPVQTLVHTCDVTRSETNIPLYAPVGPPRPCRTVVPCTTPTTHVSDLPDYRVSDLRVFVHGFVSS